jgi:hypothetical protein
LEEEKKTRKSVRWRGVRRRIASLHRLGLGWFFSSRSRSSQAGLETDISVFIITYVDGGAMSYDLMCNEK